MKENCITKMYLKKNEIFFQNFLVRICVPKNTHLTGGCTQTRMWSNRGVRSVAVAANVKLLLDGNLISLTCNFTLVFPLAWERHHCGTRGQVCRTMQRLSSFWMMWLKTGNEQRTHTRTPPETRKRKPSIVQLFILPQLFSSETLSGLLLSSLLFYIGWKLRPQPLFCIAQFARNFEKFRTIRNL